MIICRCVYLVCILCMDVWAWLGYTYTLCPVTFDVALALELADACSMLEVERQDGMGRDVMTPDDTGRDGRVTTVKVCECVPIVDWTRCIPIY